jgi:hypothetical protein
LYVDNSVGDLKNDVWHKVVYDGIDTPMVKNFSFFFQSFILFIIDL